ncbi:MAG: glycosyltransferase family 1 protein [Sedimentisphaerales bacterium]|nr:glycosyltransferase family 1 protein [Sedimentisphaerales bacterium]
MRVALFTDTYDEVNGVGNTFRYLTRYCRDEGRELDVYAHAEGKDSVEEQGTVRICRYAPAVPVDIYFDMIFDLKIPRFRIFKDFRSRGYDLVHTATPGSMGLNALIAARLSDTPVISSYHTSLPEYVRKRVEDIVARFQLPSQHSGERSETVMWEYLKWYYNQTKLVLAPSEHTRATLAEKLDTETGIFTRGIETERFDPRFRQEQEGVTVLYVGRVSTEKNLELLTELFQDITDARLLVVGDGPYRRQMEAACAGKNVLFAGFLEGEELSRAYASSDIFVFPSTTDTFGNVVLEAMSSGIPVIVTDKMGPREMVTEGENGFIARDRDEFGRRLKQLIGDKSLRKSMGQKAREYALTQSWKSVFNSLFIDYNKVIGRQSR